MDFEWMDCSSRFALRKASWKSKLITLTSEKSGNASNSSTLDLFSLSLSLSLKEKWCTLVTTFPSGNNFPNFMW